VEKLQFAVVILNRFPELAEKFIQSIRDTHEVLPQIVVVRDRHNADFGEDISVIDVKGDFIFARNANIGIQYFSTKDIILCNDDLECVEKEFFPKLHDISNKYSDCGLLSPLIQGGVGNPMQRYEPKDQIWDGSPDDIAVGKGVHFPCIVIKRKLIRRIGLLDENFVGYGWEDNDYCLRASHAGFKVMITKQLHIKHGTGEEGLNMGRNCTLSFARGTFDSKPSRNYFMAKWEE